jgi:transposase
MHKLAKRLTAEEIRALQEVYREGTSLAELQRTYSLGRGSVQKLLRNAGVRRRRESLTHERVADLVAQYAAGMTIREIATEQGLPKTTVQDALAKGGVKMRPAARRITRRKK